MRLTRRATSLLLFLVPVAILAVIAGLLAARYLRAAETRAAQVLAQTLTAALGHEVRIGGLRFEGPRIVATDVRLAAGATFRSSGEIASARRIVLLGTLRRLIDDVRSGGVVRFDAEVIGAHVRVTRDRQGGWNFQDLFRQRPGARRRPVSARLRFLESSVDYEDAALPHLLGRALPPLSASARDVSGDLVLFADGSAEWNARTSGAPSLFDDGQVAGGYDAGTGALWVDVDVREARALSLTRYVLPSQLELAAGTASGHVGVLRTRSGERFVPTLQVDIHGAAARVARIGAPLTEVAGAVRLSDRTLTLDLAGRCSGARIHASGVVDLDSPAAVQARFSALAPDIRQALAAIAPIRRVTLPAWVRAGASVAGTLGGRLDNLQIDATGSARVSGNPSPEVRSDAPVSVDFHAVGSLNAPRVYGSARTGRIRYRDTRFERPIVVATFDGRRWTADLRARAAGGSLYARATLHESAQGVRYRAVVRARQIDLVRAGLQTDQPLAGLADADVFLEGSNWTDPPDGQAIVQVSAMNYGNIVVDDLRASLRSDGSRLLVDSLVADGASGRIVASGEMDLATHEVDVGVEADRIDLAQLPVDLNDSRTTALSGRVYVRAGHVTGPAADPTFAGTLTAISPALGRYRFDYAQMRIEGTRHRLALQDALLWRLPATATFDGEILEPFSGHGLVRGAGSFSNLDVLDAARLADLKLDAVGEASGDVTVYGQLSAPTVEIKPITIAGAGYGDITPQEVSGSIVLRPDRRFEAALDVRGVDLFLPNAAITSYALLEGTGELHAAITGALRDGAAADVAGQVSLTTHGLTISGQKLGDLAATADLKDQVLTLRSSPDGSRPGARLGTAQHGIDVTNLQVNLATGDYMLGARARGLPIDVLRAAVARSPMASGTPANTASRSTSPVTDRASAIQLALQATRPFAGTVDVDLHLSGNGTGPAGRLAWSSPDITLDAAPLKRFSGSLEFDAGSATLTEAVLDTGAASLVAQGAYIPGRSLTGTAVIKHVQLERIASLFPDREGLNTLAGMADEARISVDGAPDAPNVHLSATLSDLPVRVSQNSPLPKNSGQDLSKNAAPLPAAPPAEYPQALIKRVAIDDAYIVGGKIGARNIVATIAGSASTASEYTVEAAGEVDFDRKTYRVPPDARVTATLRLPEQDTGLLTAVRPLLRRYFPALLSFEITGRLAGSITYTGTLTEWSDPQKALASGAILPDMRGDLSLLASRVRFGDMRTILTDVDAYVHFTGDRLAIGRNPSTGRPFTATMAVLDPKTGRVDPARRSDPIEFSGELPLRPDVPNVNPLRLTAHRLVFAETVLPGFGSGSAVGEISAPPAPGRKTTPDPGLSLTFQNTLLQPRISGTVHLRKTAIRLPNSLDASAFQMPVGLLQPSFANIKLQVDDQVRVATSAVAVEVRTPPMQPIVLSGDIARPRLEGSLTIEQGILAFPTARFKISRGGRVDVRYPTYASLALDRPSRRAGRSGGGTADAALNEPTLGIVVDLTAIGQVTATSAVTGRARRYTITVDAKGPLDSNSPIDVTGTDNQFSGDETQRALHLTFRSDPPDLALTSGGLQRKVTGVLGGQDAIEGLFRSDPRVARIFGDQVLGVVSANVLPNLLDRVGLTEALGFQELALDYNQLDQFSIRLSRKLAGPLDISFWHRFGAGRLTTTSERGLWEAKLSLRLGHGAQVSWTTDDQRTNAYLLEGVFHF